MISLSGKRWFNAGTSIVLELASQAGEACAALGRWIGDSAREANPRVMLAGVAAVIALGVAVAILLSTVMPGR